MLLLLACKDPQIVEIAGSNARVTVELVNPTTCSDCDPFAGIESLDLRVVQNGAVVSSERFSWPDETPVLPDLQNFGVVRIELAGVLGGRVVSAGRTAELALGPDIDVRATMVFLPANVGLPLTSPMTAPRSRHVAAVRRDGTVIIFGGVDPGRTRAYDSIDVYDPETGRFSAHAATLPHSAAEPAVMRDEEGGLLFTGGFDPQDGASLASTFTYDDITDEVLEAGELTAPRWGHCISRFLDYQGVTFGGTDDVDDADYFKPDGATGSWVFSGVRMYDVDQNDISGCVRMNDGRTWLQGRSATNSGTWDWTDDTMNTDLAGNAFTNVAAAPGVDGGIVRLMEDGRVWIAGGVESNAVTERTWIFDPDKNQMGTGPELQAARFAGSSDAWIEPGWVAAGCGWGDEPRRAPASTLELVNPGTGEASELIELDRERDGCVVTAMRDGALLVSGGHESADDGVDAAIVVPWVEN